MEDLFHLQTLGGQHARQPNERARTQWWIIYDSMTDRLESLADEKADRHEEYRRLTENAGVLADLFRQLGDVDAAAGRGTGATGVDLRSVLQSQLAVALQTMVADVNVWHDRVNQDMRRHMTRGGIAFLVLVLVLGALLVGGGLLGERAVLKPLSRLERGLETVAGGNLDFRFEMGREDEIGTVARAFDQMTRRLGEHVSEHRRVERRLQRILDTTADGILLADTEGHFVFANPAAEELFGIARETITTHKYDDLQWGIRAPDGGPLPKEELPVEQVLRTKETIEDVELGVARSDGTRRVLSANAAPLSDADGELEGVVIALRDVTEQKQLEDQLRQRALHDPLTGLANRSLLTDRVEQGLAWARRHDESLGLLMLDLDHFKRVNDQLGHTAGDRVLTEFARRLENILREPDTVARWGGDEFVVLLPQLEGPEGIVEVCARIREALRSPIEAGGEAVHVDVTIGAVVHSDTGHRGAVQTEDPGELIRFGSLALNWAKNQSTVGFSLFDPEEEMEGTARFQLERELREALEAGQFVPHYQPVVRLEDGLMVGVEALARWRHPERGLVSPAAFIPLAEELGLIGDLGEAVLRQGCRDVAEWEDEDPGGPPLQIGFNLSAQQFRDPELAEKLERWVKKAGLRPEQVTLEVTETSLMQAPTAIEETRQHGFQVYIDDFGTGYSTFAYLRDLDMDGLKVDMSFVQGIGRNDPDTALVETMITLGKRLGLSVVAEGIETEEQRQKLRAFGCERGQGFLFARPMPAEEMAARWREERS